MSRTEKLQALKSKSGKHTRNPGFISGGHWVVCDVCGMDFRAQDVRSTWDGKTVCNADWETRHPQEFVRGVSEDTSAKGLTGVEGDPVFVQRYTINPSCIADIAIASEAIASYVGPTDISGTFNPNTL